MDARRAPDASEDSNRRPGASTAPGPSGAPAGDAPSVAGTPHSDPAPDPRALIFDAAPVGLVLLEARVIVECNAHFAAMFGGPRESFIGSPLAPHYPSRDDYEKIGERLATMTHDPLYHDERVMRRRDGSLFWCRVRGQSLTPEAPFARGVWTFADLSMERPVVSLTPREREVAILTCRGLTSKEIGREINLSYRTVEVYRARLLEKFQARKLAELVAKLSGMPL